MKDSNPDKKYYRGWDDALGKMAGILQDVYSSEKQKEQPTNEEMLSTLRVEYEKGVADTIAKYEQKAQREIPLMDGDTDLYFDEWNQQNQNPTKRQCFEEGIKYAQRLQKEQKHLSTEETELNSLAFLEQMGYTCIPPQKEQKPIQPNIKREYIEKRLKGLIDKEGEYYRGAREELVHLYYILGGQPSQYLINNVANEEQKPVEIDEEINRWIGCEAFPEGTNITPLPQAMEIVERTAKHFFELGEKTVPSPGGYWEGFNHGVRECQNRIRDVFATMKLLLLYHQSNH